MSSLFETLSRQLRDDAAGDISNRIGADRSATREAIPAALGTLLTALAGNTRSGSGAEALTRALDRDHDGSVLDDLSGYLGNPQSADGGGILRHVLGEKRPQVEAGISGGTGLDAGSAGRLLELLAPIVLSALGRVRREGGLGASDLASVLSGERRQVARQAPAGLDMLGGLLDRDGDGQVADDVAEIGGSLLGNLLGGRRR